MSENGENNKKGCPDATPPNFEMDVVPTRLTEARRRSGITQSAVGRMAGKTKNSISQYERGARKPDPSTLYAYAKVCDVSADYLLGIIDEPLSSAREQHDEQDEFSMTMRGDSMSLLRICNGDKLTLCMNKRPTSGDLILARRADSISIMLYMEFEGRPVYCLDTRQCRILLEDGIEVVAVVTGVTFVPRVASLL